MKETTRRVPASTEDDPRDPGSPRRSRHRLLQELFLRARELAGDRRVEFLDEACSGDRELRQEVDLLLAHDEEPHAFVRAAVDEANEGRALHAEVSALLLCAGAESPQADEALPRSIGGYRIRRRLGQGGMGVVFEAEQEHPHRSVALKLLCRAFQSSEALRRFEHEVEFLGRLHHPGVAQIFGSGRTESEHGALPYFVMELIRGVPLTEHAREQDLSMGERLELLARVADAVQHAHENGVIHRDLKPSNILVDDSGHPKILDFGIARATGSDVELTTLGTDVGQILGTLAYMSPEQAAGDPRAIDARSDVYSLGVLLFELLEDRLPYDVSSSTLPQAVRTVREQEPRRLSTIRKTHERGVETIVYKALAKDREHRYASAAELSEDLRRFLRHEPIRARPASQLYTLERFVRRNRTIVGATLAVGCALLSGLVFSLHYGLREATQRRAAEHDAHRSNVLLTAQALGEGNGLTAVELHQRSPEHLRGWAWRYLDRNWVQELAHVTIPGARFAAYLDDARLLAVDASGAVHVWNALDGEKAIPVAAPWSAGSVALALTADGRSLLAYSEGSLMLGDPLGVSPARVPFPGRTPRPGPRTAAVTADGLRAVVTTEADEVVLVDLERGEVLPLEESGAEVLALKFDPAGGRLAVQRTSGLGFWNLDGRELEWSRGDVFGAFAFSPGSLDILVETEGRHGEGSGALLLERSTGRQSQVLERKQFGVQHFRRSTDAAFSPDQRHIAVAYETGEIVLLSADALEPARPGEEPQPGRADPSAGFMKHGTAGNLRTAFSPGGTSVMSFDPGDHTLHLWSVGAAGTSQICAGHASYVYSVAFSPDGGSIASGSWDGSVRLWSALSGEPIATLPLQGTVPGSYSQVFGVAFSPDGRQLARRSGGWLDLLSTDLGRVVAHFPLKSGTTVALSADGSWLASDELGHIRLWNARTFEEAAFARSAEPGRAPSLAFSADGGLLAIGLADTGTVTLSIPSSGKELARTSGPKGLTFYPGANALAFAPEADRLVVGWGDSRITILQVPSLAERRVLLNHSGEVLALAWSPDGKLIASGGRDGALRLWNPETGDMILRLEGHADYIKALAFSPDGTRIATASGDRTVRIWDSAPAALRWREQQAEILLRPVAEQLVASLEAVLRDAGAVVENLHADASLDPQLCRLALRVVLERESERAAGAAGDFAQRSK